MSSTSANTAPASRSAAAATVGFGGRSSKRRRAQPGRPARNASDANNAAPSRQPGRRAHDDAPHPRAPHFRLAPWKQRRSPGSSRPRRRAAADPLRPYRDANVDERGVAEHQLPSVPALDAGRSGDNPQHPGARRRCDVPAERTPGPATARRRRSAHYQRATTPPSARERSTTPLPMIMEPSQCNHEAASGSRHSRRAPESHLGKVRRSSALELSGTQRSATAHDRASDAASDRDEWLYFLVSFRILGACRLPALRQLSRDRSLMMGSPYRLQWEPATGSQTLPRRTPPGDPAPSTRSLAVALLVAGAYRLARPAVHTPRLAPISRRAAAQAAQAPFAPTAEAAPTSPATPDPHAARHRRCRGSGFHFRRTA